MPPLLFTLFPLNTDTSFKPSFFANSSFCLIFSNKIHLLLLCSTVIVFIFLSCILCTYYKISQLSDEEKAKLQGLPVSMDQALDCLEKDYEFLLEGGVFPEELIRNFVKTKRAEAREMSQIPHPAEFDRYYNL